MGKRIWLIWVKTGLLSLAVAFCAGVLYDRVFTSADERNGMTAGFIAVALYLVASLLIGLIGFVTSLLYMKFFAVGDLSGAALDELRVLKMPPPRSYHSKNFDYLTALADDSRERPDDRVMAALFAGIYKGTMGSGIIRSLTIRKALDEAILRYSQEAPTTNDPSSE